MKQVFLDGFKWLKNGDHPKDGCETFTGSDGLPFQGEGHVVRYYRHPSCDGEAICQTCRIRMHEHGWIDGGGAGLVVCPGDYICEINGKFYPFPGESFEAIKSIIL